MVNFCVFYIEGSLVELKWRASSDPFDFASQVDSKALASSMSKTKWNQYSPPLDKLYSALNFYAQCGVIMGTVNIEGDDDERDLYLFGERFLSWVIIKNMKIEQQEKAFSLETKMQVIRLDTGERQFQTGAALNLTTSIIRTLLKNKEKILSSATATTTSSATRITRSRNNKIEEMEKRLSIWRD
ncbi:phosphoenolpyruvate synthase [Trichonephila clavipes]|nr:phosphoenolpyruvate synthase [Trichonephila clavipes]